MMCSICGAEASYMRSVDKNFGNRILQYGSEIFAARCKNCKDKKEWFNYYRLRMVKVKFKRLKDGEGIDVPKYQTSGSAAFDLHAAVSEKTVVKPGEIKLIPTGFNIEVPKGHVGEVTPRSGLGAKFGISIVNSPGIIDSDYRGEIKVTMINLGKKDFVVNRNDRVAQMKIMKYEYVDIEEVDELSESERGANGFGSTGR